MIVPGAVYETNFGVVVSVVKSDEIRFSNARAVGMSTDAVSMGKEIGDALKRHEAVDAMSLIAFADGF